MPRPFPFGLSVGVDVCHVPRIYRLLSSKPERTVSRFLKKVFNEEEGRDAISVRLKVFRILDEKTKLYRTAFSEANVRNSNGGSKLEDLVPNKLLKTEILALEQSATAAARFVAGRWAAKEAIIKAHDNIRLFMNDITIVKREYDDTKGRAPYAYVHPQSWSLEDAREVKISISHDGDYATAICLAAADSAYDATDLVRSGKT